MDMGPSAPVSIPPRRARSTSASGNPKRAAAQIHLCSESLNGHFGLSPTTCATSSSPVTVVSNAFANGVSPPSSPPDECELDYHYLMWIAERNSGSAPAGTPARSPVREEPRSVPTPCGCTNFDAVDNGDGELVCISCGVVTGRLHGFS